MSAQRAQTGGTTFQKDALMRAGSSSHTMLLGNDARGPKFELSMDIAAPLSAMLSNDWELSSNELHHTSATSQNARIPQIPVIIISISIGIIIIIIYGNCI
ncbi:hypothetical protein AWZ03_012358 [Drosophila navojoa]|uniref:Uncharacterized protein n=1 Tax=Drosophila navojoa TaxID=7232 RepID=A0A484AX93_DRONA|nr:hypothetical protein AWZ03_012358 [Drosophila navojoa]